MQYLKVLKSVRWTVYVSWGYFIKDVRLGCRIRKEKLPVNFKFKLNRDLRENQNASGQIPRRSQIPGSG